MSPLIPSTKNSLNLLQVISNIIPEKFALIFDGLTISDYHYVSAFDIFSFDNSYVYLCVCLVI